MHCPVKKLNPFYFQIITIVSVWSSVFLHLLPTFYKNGKTVPIHPNSSVFARILSIFIFLQMYNNFRYIQTSLLLLFLNPVIPLQIIKRRLDLLQTLSRYMCINLCCYCSFQLKKLLNISQDWSTL